MSKHILLPTDFSDNAWSAIVYALKLFNDETCTFYLLHSTHMRASSMINITSKLQEIMNAKAVDDLSQLKEEAIMADSNSNHDFEVIMSTEDLNDAIERAVIKNNIDLVVMGTKGATGAKEFFFGSNTARAIKGIRSCAVLAVPDEFDFVSPKELAFATDFNRFYDEKEIKPLKDMADLFNSKIRIVHINEEEKLNDIQEFNFKSLKGFLQDYDHSFHWMPDYAKKQTALSDFVEELGIHVLAMVNYRHSFIEAIINEPVIKKIGYHPVVPFLVIPE